MRRRRTEKKKWSLPFKILVYILLLPFTLIALAFLGGIAFLMFMKITVTTEYTIDFSDSESEVEIIGVRCGTKELKDVEYTFEDGVLYVKYADGGVGGTYYNEITYLIDGEERVAEIYFSRMQTEAADWKVHLNIRFFTQNGKLGVDVTDYHGQRKAPDHIIFDDIDEIPLQLGISTESNPVKEN